VDKEDSVGSGAAIIDEKHCDLSDWEVQYQQMSLDERLMLELQSIGLLPFETVGSLLLFITLNDTFILNQLFIKYR
jgi:hypothetical protein